MSDDRKEQRWEISYGGLHNGKKYYYIWSYDDRQYLQRNPDTGVLDFTPHDVSKTWWFIDEVGNSGTRQYIIKPAIHNTECITNSAALRDSSNGGNCSSDNAVTWYFHELVTIENRSHFAQLRGGVHSANNVDVDFGIDSTAQFVLEPAGSAQMPDGINYPAYYLLHYKSGKYIYPNVWSNGNSYAVELSTTKHKWVYENMHLVAPRHYSKDVSVQGSYYVTQDVIIYLALEASGTVARLFDYESSSTNMSLPNFEWKLNPSDYANING